MFESTTLGHVLDFFNGKSIKPGGEGTLPVFGSNGIIGGSDEHLFDEGIVIGRVGAYCGSIAYCSGKFWASDNTIVAKPKDPSASTRYFAYLLQALNLNRHAGGSAQPLVTQTVLRAVSANVADVFAQRRIANVLSAYDDLIENNTRRIAILEEMGRRIYEEWFVRFRFPGHEIARLIEPELAPVPAGWSVKPLGEIAEVTMGLSPKGDTYNERGDGTPLVNGPVEFGERFTRKVKWTTAPTKLSASGDLIVCVRGSTTGKYVKSDDEYCLGRGVCAIRSKHQCFIDQVFTHQLPILLAQTGGSTFPSWTGPQLKGHAVLTPPTELLVQFESIVGPMSRAIYTYAKQNTVLQLTRDLLLPKLVSGDLDISSLPEPEAAVA